MERPSHIIFDTKSHYFSRRLPMIGLALSLQFATVWLFTHGLIDISKVNIFHPRVIDLVPVVEPKEPPAKPPEAKISQKVKSETPKPPHWTTEQKRGGTSIKPPPAADDPPVRGPDRALTAVGNHTVPPYPPIARRIGVEGKVILRLTVSIEGKVIAAEVVSSSGRDDMDQTAQQWIMAHWAYRPALDNGAPVIGHVLASVNFNLINQR